MKNNGILLYISIIALNLFLFLPVFFSFGLLIPIHIVIYWLSFSKILSLKGFTSDWPYIKFAGIAFLSQWAFIIIITLWAEDWKMSLREFISGPIFLVTFVTTIIEFIILYFIYSEYKKKRSAENAGG